MPINDPILMITKTNRKCYVQIQKEAVIWTAMALTCLSCPPRTGYSGSARYEKGGSPCPWDKSLDSWKLCSEIPDAVQCVCGGSTAVPWSSCQGSGILCERTGLWPRDGSPHPASSVQRIVWRDVHSKIGFGTYGRRLTLWDAPCATPFEQPDALRCPQKTADEVFWKNVYVTASGHFNTQEFLNTMSKCDISHIMFSFDTPYKSLDEAALWFDNVLSNYADRLRIGRRNAIDLL